MMVLMSLTAFIDVYDNETKSCKEDTLSNETVNERELSDEELAGIFGGVTVGDNNIANITNSSILQGNAVQLGPVTVSPQTPVTVNNTSPIRV
jgi:hypothetical protein